MTADAAEDRAGSDQRSPASEERRQYRDCGECRVVQGRRCVWDSELRLDRASHVAYSAQMARRNLHLTVRLQDEGKRRHREDQVVLPDGSVVAIIKLKSAAVPASTAVARMRWASTDQGRCTPVSSAQPARPQPRTRRHAVRRWRESHGRGSENEFSAIDVDGLGLGVLGPTPAFRWHGMWLDHNEQYRAFVGNDGKPYLVTGDYYSQAYHWQALLATTRSSDRACR